MAAVATTTYTVSAQAEDSSQQAEQTVYAEWNEDGDLIQPEGYREWVFVGTPLTPNELNNGKAAFPEFHNVYIDPESYTHYRTTGEFPDGTVIIKELLSVGDTQAVSGRGYFQGEYIGLEAAIKNSEHHPEDPGNWAYYSFTNEEGGEYGDYNETATAFPAPACNSCHAAAAADDFVFTQYYPVLRAAKAEFEASNADSAE